MIRWLFSLPAEPQRILVEVRHEWIPPDPSSPHYANGHWMTVEWQSHSHINMSRFVTQEFIDHCQPKDYAIIRSAVGNGFMVVVSVSVTAKPDDEPSYEFLVTVRDKDGQSQRVPRTDHEMEPISL